MARLDELDLSLKLSKDEEGERLDAGWKRLSALRLALGGKLPGYEIGPPLLVLFEGWDASGKGGAIKRLVSPLDARHVRVAQFAAPTPDELRHHYLWRFWPHLPGWGGMAVFDRTWYGRVLVERVEGLCSRDEWMRAYDEINQFEEELADARVVVCKFWLQISQEEQLRRFRAREKTPFKRFKITPDDWRNRKRWRDYEQAAADMIERTSTDLVPWTLVEAEDKRFARVKVLRTICERLDAALRR
jgi:polyphosphate kinase 2 (PPK2 family)